MRKFVLNNEEQQIINKTKDMIRKFIRLNNFDKHDMISISLILYALEKIPIPADNVKIFMEITTKNKEFNDYQSLNLTISNEIVSMNLTNHIDNEIGYENQSEEIYSLLVGGQFNTSCRLSKIDKIIKFFIEEYRNINFYNYG